MILSGPFVNPCVSSASADSPKTAAVIVAHPDDETLWAGGTIISHPSWRWYIVTLCRASDADRAPRFLRVLRALHAAGKMGDMDDSPEQKPLDGSEVQSTIMDLLPIHRFNLVISHSPYGEYTRHLRHEEVSRAVIALWAEGMLAGDELWAFAYEDGGRRYLPRPIENASLYTVLPERIWQAKYQLVTGIYGFPPDGFEARTTPHAEAFWRFTDPATAKAWSDQRRGRA